MKAPGAVLYTIKAVQKKQNKTRKQKRSAPEATQMLEGRTEKKNMELHCMQCVD